MVPSISVEAEQRSQIAPDRPVIRINWPRVALVLGLPAAMLGTLLTLVFRAAGEHNAQAAWGGAVAAAPILSASQVDPATPQFITEMAVEGTDDQLPLGIFVRGPREVASSTAIEIIGLPSGWTLSVGRPFGEHCWRIPTAKLSGVAILPPRDFAGAVDLIVELRLADDTLVERRPIRRTRTGPALAMEHPQPIEPSRSMAIQSLPPSASLAENNPSEQATSNIREPDSQQVVLLLRVAEGFLNAGDLSAARTLLWRAAKAGNPQAALALGGTYDPAELRRIGVPNFQAQADPAKVREWYRRAVDLGSAAAALRLERLP